MRLRFINGSANSIFDVRIPGLKLTVIAADGQDVEPVTVDEFRIATAETYDVIIQSKEERAYSLFAQSIDRSGYACGTLAPRAGMRADVPPLDTPQWLTMMDMMDAMATMEGMPATGAQAASSHGSMEHMKHDGTPVDRGAMPGMNHGGMEHHDMSGTGMSAMQDVNPT